MIGVSDILEEGRDQGRRGERYGAAGGMGFSGAGYIERTVPESPEAIILHLDYLSSDK